MTSPIGELYKDCPMGRTGGGTAFIDLTNDFIAYLSFVNAEMLNKGNLLCFDYAMRNLPSSNPIVEIGSFCGLSTNLLAYFQHKHGAKNEIFNCDRWEFEVAGGNVGDTDIRMMITGHSRAIHPSATCGCSARMDCRTRLKRCRTIFLQRRSEAIA